MEKVSKRKSHQCIPPPEPFPWLVFPYSKREKKQVFCSVLKPNKTYHKSIPELQDTIVHVQCYGWLLLSHKTALYNFTLWNLLTSESIQLPALEESQKTILDQDEQYISYTLSSSPVNCENCMVLLFVSDPPSILFCRPNSIENHHNRWTEIRYNSNLIREKGVLEDENDFLCNPIFCNGTLYAMIFQTRELVTINYLDKEKPEEDLLIESLPCKRPQRLGNTILTQNYLIESCGQLYYICIRLGGISDEEIIAVQILKLDWYRMVWEKPDSLRGQAFFVDRMSRIALPAIDQYRDCIYFPMKKDVYEFNVIDGCLSVTLPCKNLPTPWQSPIWLMMDNTLSSNHMAMNKEEQGEDIVIEESIEVHVKEENDSTLKGSLENMETAVRIHLFDLPSHVLKLIIDCLSLFDYLNFRAASWHCRSITTPILSNLKTPLLSPCWLMFSEYSNMGVHNFIDPAHGGSRFLMTVPAPLVDTRICHSKKCWLLLSNNNDLLSCYNPFIKTMIDLPAPVPPGCACEFSTGFSSLPTSSKCVVVAMSWYYPLAVTVYIGIPGGQEYKIESREIDDEQEFRLHHCSPVFHNGAFNFLGQDGDLGVLRLDEDMTVCQWGVLDKPESPCTFFHEAFLLECNGKLVSVFVGHMGKWVKVFRLNDDTMNWERVESLGNYMLFVSKSSCLSAEARIKGMENKIYFPRFCGNSILHYSLETRKFHTFDREDSLENFYNTREQLLAGWIEPNW